MKVIPLEDRVLIKTAELEEKTKSGLFIPQTAQEKTQVGVVTAVGSDKEEIKVKVGQKIMYDKYAGTSIKVDGAEYLIIKSKDILAVIED
ncbi:MAG: co-chaperone GroES [Spirochaetia bacterium]|jgi:chaperonin GroES|nr:co-chaperone GroES [Spirochaetia bacterium]MBR3672152.1 co-chaperone GroES [Spirochaetia bacterium]